MYKKLITACMAIAAFAAFVVPSTASATNDPTLVEGATPLAVGSKIVGTNIGVIRFVNTSGSALVTCSESYQTGEVVANAGGTVEGTIETTDFWGTGEESKHNITPECTGSFGNFYFTVTGQLCVRSTPAMVTHEFQIQSATGTCTGLGNVEFVIGSTSIGACEYRATGAVKGELVATGGDEAKITPTQTASGASKVSGSFLCPHSLQLDMTFTLETENGTAVNVIDRP